MALKQSSSIVRFSLRRAWPALGLVVIALPTFHVVSTLVFAILGVSPSHSRWPLLLTFAGVLAIAGMTVGLHSQLVTSRSRHNTRPRLQTLTGTISGLASGAILGFFIGGQLGDQQLLWAVIGLAIGGLCLGGVSAWAYRKQPISTQQRGDGFASFCRSSLALISGICAYGLTFGLGAWTWMALSSGRIGMAVFLGLFAALSLWCTRQALGLAVHYLRA